MSVRKNIFIPLSLMFFCTLFTTFGQFVWKIASNEFNTFFEFIFNFNVWLGFVFYGIGSVFLLLSLKRLNLSVAYPILATGYIWTLILSFLFLNEQITFTRGVGVSLILIGIINLGKGSDIS